MTSSLEWDATVVGVCGALPSCTWPSSSTRTRLAFLFNTDRSRGLLPQHGLPWPSTSTRTARVAFFFITDPSGLVVHQGPLDRVASFLSPLPSPLSTSPHHHTRAHQHHHTRTTTRAPPPPPHAHTLILVMVSGVCGHTIAYTCYG